MVNVTATFAGVAKLNNQRQTKLSLHCTMQVPAVQETHSCGAHSTPSASATAARSVSNTHAKMANQAQDSALAALAMVLATLVQLTSA